MSTEESQNSVEQTTGNNIEQVSSEQNTENKNTENKKVIREKKYEVVFFTRFEKERPSEQELIDLFSKYGQVHHTIRPERKTNIAFVFMTSLSTTDETLRIKSTISQIIADMTDECKFRVSVARSNRKRGNNPKQNNRRRGQRKLYNPNTNGYDSVQTRNTNQKRGLRSN